MTSYIPCSLVPRPSHPSVCRLQYCKRQTLGPEGLGTRLHTLYIWHFTAVAVNPLPIYGKCICIPYLWTFQCCQQKLLLENESWGMWKSPPLPCPCWERNSINQPRLYTGPAHYVSEGQVAEYVDSWKLSHSSRWMLWSIVMKIQVSIVFPVIPPVTSIWRLLKKKEVKTQTNSNV